ncbi:amidohydrolase [Candidatus Bathyarchaeota archaeon]|nr:MAG: amidohydrolase [Candidatus Bathyarchaeota archaeon]
MRRSMDWWEKYYIVDAHAHIRLRDPLFGVEMSPERLRRLMKKYNYARCIIMSKDNAAVERAVRGSKDLLANVWVNPKERDCCQVLRRYLQKENFVGVKLHPLFDGYLPHDPIVHPVVEVAEEFDVPIQFHCGHPPFSLPWSFEPLAREFPQVKMVLLHMGHGHVVYINGAIEVAERNPNIYLETSGMPMHTKIKEAVERVGRDRVLYGDDIPCGHPSWELEKTRAAGLVEEDLRRVLGENARRLYSLE